MKFYNMLQLDPSTLKKYIKESQTTKEKQLYFFAIITRAILLVVFSIIYISILTTFFGQKNSSMAVVLFCALLSIRFVDFGYKITHSLISLAIIFLILLISPLLMQNIPPFLGLIVNFLSILTILVYHVKNQKWETVDYIFLDIFFYQEHKLDHLYFISELK